MLNFAGPKLEMMKGFKDAFLNSWNKCRIDDYQLRWESIVYDVMA